MRIEGCFAICVHFLLTVSRYRTEKINLVGDVMPSKRSTYF